MAGSDGAGQGRAPDATAAVEAVVHGWVQGVGFRFFALGRATALGLTGWVANEPDGTVRCLAEGSRADLERLLAALRDGPPGAAVTRVEASWRAPSGRFDRFSVRSAYHPGD